MAWPIKDTITKGVVELLRVNMELQKGEKLLVMTDIPRESDWQTETGAKLMEMCERNLLARMIADIAAERYPDCMVSFFAFPCTGGHGVEVGRTVASKMLEADVLLAVNNYSLSHTNARMEATKAGVRVASMPGFEAKMLEPGGPMAADYVQISVDCNAFARIITEAKEARVVTDYGTDLRFSLEGRPGNVDDGLFASGPGKWGNLPAGEVYAVPLEGTGSGKLVVPAGWFEGLSEEIEFYLENGEVNRIQGGGSVGDRMRTMLDLGSNDAVHKARRNLAELGVGTNPNAANPENTLESEKIKGTVHIAFGDNLHMGGRVESDFHDDFVQPKPTLFLDGKVVIREGKWKI
jgi:leucyl aminopeptidase (aminopeptidase T)